MGEIENNTTSSSDGKKAGRPKGSKSVTKARNLTEVLQALATRKNKDGHDSLDLIGKEVLKRARAGERWATELVFDRLEGKAIARNQTDITSGGESLSANVNFVKAGQSPKEINASVVSPIELAQKGEDNERDEDSPLNNQCENDSPLNNYPTEENPGDGGAHPFLNKNEE